MIQMCQVWWPINFMVNKCIYNVFRFSYLKQHVHVSQCDPNRKIRELPFQVTGFGITYVFGPFDKTSHRNTKIGNPCSGMALLLNLAPTMCTLYFFHLHNKSMINVRQWFKTIFLCFCLTDGPQWGNAQLVLLLNHYGHTFV